MKEIAAICAIIAAVLFASAIWGWWGFGIATACAVVVVTMVVSNRRAATPAAGGAAPSTGSEKKKADAVLILESIGGIAALVVFGVVAIGVVGLLKNCGGVVNDELMRLHNVYPGKASAAPAALPATQSKPTPASFTPTEVTLIAAQIPAKKRVQVSFGDRTIFPAGTEVAFFAEGCGTWKYRGVTPAQDKDPGWNAANPWRTATGANEGFVLTRQSWIEVTTEKSSCRMGFQIVQLGPTIKI